MKLQCISVCVNYGDFLSHTIANAPLFDRWIIVTDTKDIITPALCASVPNIICVKTDVFYRKGIFNKFAGINEGLKHISPDAWVLFLDSDMLLHPETRRVLDNLILDTDCLYGMDRLNCVGEDALSFYQNDGGQLKGFWLLDAVNLKMGARLVHLYGMEGDNGKFRGWNPLGYFQLCHRDAFSYYPDDCTSADHCDLVFTTNWHRSKRILIPELYAVHLESNEAEKAINWQGRKSIPFRHKEKSHPSLLERIKAWFCKVFKIWCGPIYYK